MQTPSPRFVRSLSIAAITTATGASTAAAGLGDFFILNNTGGPNAGLYRGQVGIDDSASQLGPLPGLSWLDLAPGFDASFVFAMNGKDLVRLSTANGSQINTVSPDREFINIAADTATSTLYAVTRGIPGTPTMDELVTVDPVTGQTTAIGQLNASTEGMMLVGLGFDPVGDQLFLTAGTGEVFSINPNTAAASLIGDTGLGAAFDVDFNPADGNMYVTDAFSQQLYILNRADAGLTPSTLHAGATLSTGLAFAIPTPGTAALLALAGLGATRRRR